MPELNHLLKWQDVPHEIWLRLVDRAVEHATTRQWSEVARKHSVALLFFNPSLRTRTSMEMAAAQLGAHTSNITPGSGTWAFDWSPSGVMNGLEAEHIEEAVAVLSQYFDAIGVRLFASLTDLESDRGEARLHTLAEAATVPVINLESAFWHPCQELADAATLAQRFGDERSDRRFVLAWASHPKALPMAVPNSALMMAARSGMHVTVARPEGYELDDSVMAAANAAAKISGGAVAESSDLDDALQGADVVYAKAWGGRLVYDDPEREAQRRAQFSDWRITLSRMKTTRNGAFMHCLPVRRNVVVDTDVLKSRHALHVQQAGFRLHAQKAILEHVWGLL